MGPAGTIELEPVAEAAHAYRAMLGEHFIIRARIPSLAKLFIKVSDTHIWPHAAALDFPGWRASCLNQVTPWFASISLSGAKASPPAVVKEETD